MRAPSPTIEAAADPAVAALEARLAGCPWRLLHSGPAPGAWNMALDEALLHAAAREDTPPTLRLYGWDPPCVSLGHFQETGGVRLEYARERGWDVVRRPTGGRGVLHHREVTYSLVLPPSVVGGAGVRTSYCALTRALNAGLRLLLGTGSPAPAGPPAAADGAARRPREANCFALAGEGDTLSLIHI